MKRHGVGVRSVRFVRTEKSMNSAIIDVDDPVSNAARQ